MVAETPLLIESPSLTKPGSQTIQRVLGLAGMIGSPFLFLSLAANGFAQGNSNQLGAALGLIFAVGWFAEAEWRALDSYFGLDQTP